VEEQFYVLFPFLILLAYKKFSTRAYERALCFLRISIMPILALCSLYLSYWMGKNNSEMAYYLLPSRFWELAVGVFLFQFQDYCKADKLSYKSSTTLLAVGTTMIVFGYLWADVHSFPFPWALLPVLGTALSIHAITWVEADQRGLLATRAFVYIGRISFSLYLWHWPVYTILRWTTGLESLLSIVLALFLTFGFAMLSYHLIEVPVRRTSLMRERRLATVTAGITATLLFWGISWQLFQHRESISLSVTADTYTWYPYAYPVSRDDDAPQSMLGRQLFVIGNSHTGAYSTMLHQLHVHEGVDIKQMETGACAIGNLMYPIDDMPGCRELAERYLKQVLEQAKPNDMVFLASLRTHRLSDQWGRNDPDRVLADSQSNMALQKITQARNEASNWIKAINDNGIHVLIDGPKPVLKAPPYRCSDWFNRMHPLCSEGLSVPRDYIEQLRTPVVNSIQQLVQQFDNVHYWDPLSSLCDHHECSAYDSSGQPYFFDGDHLSGHGNRILYPDFSKTLRKIWTGP
jgi:hypothetical protein